MDATLRALNRFGLGARIGQPRTIADPRGWLIGQLGTVGGPESASGPFTAPGLPTLAEAGNALRAQRQAPASDPEAARAARATFQAIRQAEIAFSLGRRIETETPFVERLVAFWSNHLCVSMAGKQPVVALAGLYEREVIRPHVLGRFADMVLASAKHPAMLFYLDNFQSIGPGSRRARNVGPRQQRQRGLNENYARELLELHTLGVDGGYSQADVEALARILTGWTLAGAGPQPNAALAFQFDPVTHEPGPKTLLGVTYRENGVAEGEAAIRALVAHPSTARFVATKLVRHFVADEPPAAAVDRVAEVFRSTEGDLRAVSAALVTLDEAWDPSTRKLRSPQDWIVAVLRASGTGASGATQPRGRPLGAQVPQFLEQLRHALWSPPSPKGYGDTAADWTDPDGLMNRAELARTLVPRLAMGRVNPGRFLEVLDVADADPIRTTLVDEAIPVEERVALAIAGPAFQWR